MIIAWVFIFLGFIAHCVALIAGAAFGMATEAGETKSVRNVFAAVWAVATGAGIGFLSAGVLML